jgi:E3 SUMO-protein ligase NSE2
MPVATSSRRRTNGRANRQPSSDGIEEDQPTQHRGEDDEVDDEDEDEQPSRSARAKKEKISKGKPSHPKAHAGDNDEGEDDDEGRIDVENFKDQPLAREDAGKVAGIIKDWEMIRKQSQSGASGWMENIGVSMADLMDEEEAKKVTNSIDLQHVVVVTIILTARVVPGRA